MADTAPLVTIGMPVYNAAQDMMAAVEDFLSQTFTDFELVLSDNDSSDDTGALCEALARRDARVRYFRQEKNVGIVENQNTLFRLATGRYFKWASSNDRCDPTFVAKCIDVLERHDDVVLCYPRTLIIDGEDRVLEEFEDNLHLMQDESAERFIRTLALGLNNPFNGVFRRQALLSGMPMGQDFGCDLTMLSKLALDGKIYELPEFLFRRRLDDASWTKLRLEKGDAESEDYLFGRDGTRASQDFQTLKRHYRLIRAVCEARLPWPDKVALFGSVMRRLAWHRNELPREIYTGFARKLGRA